MRFPLLCALALLLLSGCGAGDDWSRPELGDPVPAFEAADSLPFDAYQLADDELTALQQAEVKLLDECAREFGVTIDWGGDYLRPSDNSLNMWGGRLGTMSEAHAARYGYHAAPDGLWAPVSGFYLKDPSNIQPPPNDPAAILVAYGPSASNDQDDTANGKVVPPGGCIGKVDTALASPLTSFVKVASTLINLAMSDDRVRQATTRWSNCMKDAGHRFGSPLEAADDFTMVPVSTEETAVAVADVRCVRQSRWADLFYAILGDYQRQALEKDPDHFAKALDSQTARLAAVRGTGPRPVR